jgi:hypothetical protein
MDSPILLLTAPPISSTIRGELKTRLWMKQELGVQGTSSDGLRNNSGCSTGKIPQNSHINRFMLTTVHEVTPLTDHALNEIVKNVEVRYDNGQRLNVENWVRLTKGETEIYVGDRQLVITFINTRPIDHEDVEKISEETRTATVNYLIQEGFILPNWVYVGLQNAHNLFESSFE